MKSLLPLLLKNLQKNHNHFQKEIVTDSSHCHHSHHHSEDSQSVDNGDAHSGKVLDVVCDVENVNKKPTIDRFVQNRKRFANGILPKACTISKMRVTLLVTLFVTLLK